MIREDLSLESKVTGEGLQTFLWNTELGKR
jgi:hypothetical protein